MFRGPDPNFGAPTDDGGFYDWIVSHVCPGCNQVIAGECPFEGREADACPDVIRAMADRDRHALGNDQKRPYTVVRFVVYQVYTTSPEEAERIVNKNERNNPLVIASKEPVVRLDDGR
ncbi:MAG: hypothetical protein PHR28_04940 [candidate division Zixibacteria bacterium]|jgi:hypothetical protein|nr:hypothetical protein [candidate division Zixibacteria bacterium]